MTDMTNIERLFRENYRQLHRLAKMLLHDGELARDIVHDVFVSLLSGSKDANVSVGFLLNAVRNKCLNYIRDTSVSQRLASQYYLDIEDYETEDWPDEETIKEIYLIFSYLIYAHPSSYISTLFPNGKRASFISLKCCIPKGIPTIVMQNKTPHAR